MGWNTLILPVLATIGIAGPLRACGLALLLAVDVSGSVDSEEFRLQMDGLAEGLRDPVVAEALVAAEARVALMQWTGTSRQRITIDWTVIDSFEAADGFADLVEADPRVWRNYSTAIGEALVAAHRSFAAVAECERRIVDVSGDGDSNEGLTPTGAHARLRADGITVNALAIEASEPDLTAYFFENVITGEGAFVVTATDFEDYPERIRLKLQRETTKALSGLPDGTSQGLILLRASSQNR